MLSYFFSYLILKLLKNVLGVVRGVGFYKYVVDFILDMFLFMRVDFLSIF